MDAKTIEETIGYLAILVGTIGILAEVSFYHKLLELLNSSEISSGVNPIGINLLLAFLTLMPPIILLIGLAFITKKREEKSQKEKTRKKEEKTKGGL